MTKADRKELTKCEALLAYPHYAQAACRGLATLHRMLGNKDQAEIIALIASKGLSDHFSTINGALIAH